jgi:uncharacterized surface protein with fasciclin (FAS1) repeats
MTHFTKLLLFFLSLFVLTNCQDKFDEYYERPDWLAAPIYQQLESRGNFTHFLAIIDKAGYKQTLSTAGYWTIFAPTDEAFQKYFQENSISDVQEIDEATARKIVGYALVYNSFTQERLADYQAPTGWLPSNAFRRRTAYYTGVYTGVANGAPAKLIDANRNGNYVFGDNNNKYIPYFTDEYFSAKNLSAEDYNFFFPNTPFSGFNVAGASVVQKDIAAENGTIHVVDKVIVALPNMDQYLSSKPEYSEFRNLLDKYGQVNPLVMNQQATDRNRVLTGSSDPVYVKLFRPSLAFSPNNENYLKQSDNDGQNESWSMFVPTNEVLTNYINTVLLEHYNSLDEMDPQIIYDFINSHLWQNAVWPSKFATPNFVGEPARFDRNSNIVEAKVLSNGMFYGTNKVQQSDAFHSVFGKAYLDPKYSLMTRLLQRELRYSVSNPNTRFTMFMISDEVLQQAGYTFDVVNNTYEYNNSSTQAIERLTRLLNLHIALSRNDEFNDLSGEGIVETYGGEFVRYKNGRVIAAGNTDLDEEVAVTATKNASNGLVHYLGEPLRFPENKSLGFYIRDLGDASTKPYFKFYEYLKNSAVFTAATGDIAGVLPGAFYTAFIPTNVAMDAAVAAGLLPANVKPSDPVEKEMVEKFIQYHILSKKTIAANGNAVESGSFETVYKTIEGTVTTLNVQVTPGPIGKFSALTVTDMNGRTANLVPGANSNVLANRALIHQIDTYLNYNN